MQDVDLYVQIVPHCSPKPLLKFFTLRSAWFVFGETIFDYLPFLGQM